MGTRARRYLKRQRTARAASAFPMSAFTVFLIIFSLTFWVANLWATLALRGNFCHWANYWLDGWFEYRSLLQMFGAIIAASVALFSIRAVNFRKLKLHIAEVVFQGLLILWLVLVVLGLKVWLMPNASPTFDAMGTIFRVTHPPAILLIEERRSHAWVFEFPAPPVDPYPGNSPTAEMIFPDEHAPLWSEYQEMKTCRAKTNTYVDAYLKWQEDFRAWYEEECKSGKCPEERQIQ